MRRQRLRAAPGGWCGVLTVDAGRLGCPHRAGGGGSLAGASFLFLPACATVGEQGGRPANRRPGRRGRATDGRQGLPRSARTRVATHPERTKTRHGGAHRTGSAAQAVYWTGGACHSRLASAAPPPWTHSSNALFAQVRQERCWSWYVWCFDRCWPAPYPRKVGAPPPPLHRPPTTPLPTLTLPGPPKKARMCKVRVRLSGCPPCSPPTHPPPVQRILDGHVAVFLA